MYRNEEPGFNFSGGAAGDRSFEEEN